MVRGRPRKFDVNNALEVAMKLFWAHGYEGTSIALLAKEIGVKVPSLYAAFGNKEGLFFRAVEYYGNMAGCMYHDAFAKKTSYEMAESILNAEVDLVTGKDTPVGCLVMHGALVTSPESDKVQKTMAEMRRMAEGWIVDRLKKYQKEGYLPFDADPEALACYLMTLNSGIAVQAKSGATKKELKKVVALALHNWPFSE